jgi:hypothetical protein
LQGCKTSTSGKETVTIAVKPEDARGETEGGKGVERRKGATAEKEESELKASRTGRPLPEVRLAGGPVEERERERDRG